jgi:inhibitor of cysteine peptidase
MKRLTLTLTLFFAIAAATPVLALSPHSPVLLETDATAPITINVGEEFFIALQSNPSTGYSWTQQTGDGNVLAYEGNVRQNPNPTIPGAPGQQIFIYHANRSGTSTITFQYSRPFEPNNAPGKMVTFTITVP